MTARFRCRHTYTPANTYMQTVKGCTYARCRTYKRARSKRQAREVSERRSEFRNRTQPVAAIFVEESL